MSYSKRDYLSHWVLSLVWIWQQQILLQQPGVRASRWRTRPARLQLQTCPSCGPWQIPVARGHCKRKNIHVTKSLNPKSIVAPIPCYLKCLFWWSSTWRITGVFAWVHGSDWDSLWKTSYHQNEKLDLSYWWDAAIFKLHICHSAVIDLHDGKLPHNEHCLGSCAQNRISLGILFTWCIYVNFKFWKIRIPVERLSQ